MFDMIWKHGCRARATVLVLLVLMQSLPIAVASEEAARAAYDLDLRLDFDQGVVRGRMHVALPAGTERARLNLAAEGGREIKLTAVSVDGRAVTPSRSQGAVAEVPFDGGRTVEVAFETPLDEELAEPFGYYLLGPLGDRRFVYPELLEPDGRALEADFRVRLDHPSELTVFTTGGIGRSSSDNERTVSEFAVDRVRGFAIVAGEGYRVYRREGPGVPVVAFFHPDHEERFRYVIDRTAEAAQWYQRTYGFFPLDEVGIIQGHPRWGGGYPLPNMFAIHLGNLQDDHLAWITAHELGHYYWGYTVLTPREASGAHDLNWLTLALGIWGDQLYLAQRSGISLAEQFRRDRGQGAAIMDYFQALSAGHDQRIDVAPAEQATFDFDYNSLIRHGKAAVGVYLQSMLIGPERFLQLQRRILSDHAGQPLHPDTFISILEQNGSPDAGQFFEAWNRDNAAVDVVVHSVEEADQGWTVTLRRTGSVPYPVTVMLVSSESELREEVPAAAATHEIHSPYRPTKIVIDPDGIVPLPNASHPEMKGALAGGMDRARRDEWFLVYGMAVLSENPDDHYLRYRLARRLYQQGRYEETVALWPPGATRCGHRDLCLAANRVILALAALDRLDQAVTLTNQLATDAGEVGLVGQWSRLEQSLIDNEGN